MVVVVVGTTMPAARKGSMEKAMLTTRGLEMKETRLLTQSMEEERKEASPGTPLVALTRGSQRQG